MNAASGPVFSIVALFYNEEKAAEQAVGKLWTALKNLTEPFELLLVDNGSRDQTGSILRAWSSRHAGTIHVVRVEKNRGYGWGWICGARPARGRWVAFIPGDGQLPPDDLVRLLKLACEHQAKILKGRRRERSEGLWRRAVSCVYNAVFRVLFGSGDLRDINGQPKIVERELWHDLGPVSKDWFIDAELMLKALERGVTIEEADVESTVRAGGGSHVKWTAIIEFFINLARWRLTGGRAWKERSQARTEVFRP
ncbi:MAG: glycosyltransferase family 2 protein [Elusimicrobia bacterium]|nr:glycosyltransferase family 2 protein [Elusimicrobiota bacterium]